MKVKLPKPKVIAIFFIFIMIFSTFAFTFLQAINPTSRNEVKLPESNMIDYELTIEQENLALSQGRTIAKIYYYTGCLECTNQLSLLEYMANQFPNQVIVEKILTEGTTSLSITSYRGERILTNATQEQTVDVFCELMIEPPIACATRKV